MIPLSNSDDFFQDNDGTKQMTWTLGKRMVQLREDRGLLQQDVADRADISKRTLRHMERCERPVKLWEIRAVAHVLGVLVDEIRGESADTLQPDFPWQQCPIPLYDPRLVWKALAYDMNGDFNRALEVLQAGLDQLDPHDPDDLRDWAFLCVKRDSIRSNAGRNMAALEGLDRLLDAHGRSFIPRSKLRGLIDFHRGVILRRLEYFDDAALLFDTLQHNTLCAPGSWHQLGVLAAIGAGSDRKSALFDSARVLLTKSLEVWAKGAGSHRAGFSERRLAEIHLAGGDRETATAYLDSACQRFEQASCTRYVNETKALLHQLR